MDLWNPGPPATGGVIQADIACQMIPPIFTTLICSEFRTKFGFRELGMHARIRVPAWDPVVGPEFHLQFHTFHSRTVKTLRSYIVCGLQIKWQRCITQQFCS